MATQLKERPRPINYVVNIAPRRGVADGWNVEAIDEDGSIEQTIFAGPDAEARARAYAEHQYNA